MTYQSRRTLINWQFENPRALILNPNYRLNQNTFGGTITQNGATIGSRWRLMLGPGGGTPATCTAKTAQTTVPLAPGLPNYYSFAPIVGGAGAAGYVAAVQKLGNIPAGGSTGPALVIPLSWGVWCWCDTAAALRPAFYDAHTDGTAQADLSGTAGTLNFGKLFGIAQDGTNRTFGVNQTVPSAGAYHSGGSTWEYIAIENVTLGTQSATTGNVPALELWMEKTCNARLGGSGLVMGPRALPSTVMPQYVVVDAPTDAYQVRQFEGIAWLYANYVATGATDVRSFVASAQTHLWQTLTPNWSDIQLTDASETNVASIAQIAIPHGGTAGMGFNFTVTPTGAGQVIVNRTYRVVATNFV